jgi:hypothetical protein
MAAVEINKTAYVGIVSNTADAYSAQCRGSHGFELLCDSVVPTGPGILVPPAPGSAATRLLGEGKVYARVPGNAPYETDIVVVTP